MDRTLDVRTPESITFSYELAGLGSRFLAVSVDFIIQWLILIAIVWGFAYAGTRLPGARSAPGFGVLDRTAESIVIAIIVFTVFMIFFGYFILFEAFWNGQTPGKKLFGLRVVRDGGFPVDFGSAAIRNLIRVGELVFGLYAIAALSALLSSENKRLGDIAAGTLVVREAAALPLRVPEELSRPDEGALLSERERVLIDQFIARRHTIEPAQAARMARRLAERVRSRVSPELQNVGDEELLRRLSAS